MNSKNNRNGGRYYYNYDTSRRNAGKGKRFDSVIGRI